MVRSQVGISTKITNIIVEILNINKPVKKEIFRKIEGIVRKLAHFLIYTLLGICTMAFANTFNAKEKKKLYITVMLGFLYACSDELHQSFIGGRAGRFADVIIDTLGIIFGALIIVAFKETQKKITTRLQKD